MEISKRWREITWHRYGCLNIRTEIRGLQGSCHRQGLPWQQAVKAEESQGAGSQLPAPQRGGSFCGALHRAAPNIMPGAFCNMPWFEAIPQLPWETCPKVPKGKEQRPPTLPDPHTSTMNSVLGLSFPPRFPSFPSHRVPESQNDPQIPKSGQEEQQKAG